MVSQLLHGFHFAKAFPGMFLWVRLVMKSLEECHSVRELEDAVDTLPEGLDQAQVSSLLQS
jgi:hypothetical protein